MVKLLVGLLKGAVIGGAIGYGAYALGDATGFSNGWLTYGVVGMFVEFFGPGLEHLTLADRATLGNMCPEYGATIAIFPIDAMTLDYLRLSIKYLVFDLEATRREYGYLRKMLEETSGDETH